MSAESSIIREFLVALGFKVDKGALNDLEGGVEKATKTVLRLGTAIEATALAVAAGVTKFASNMEALYFSSIKANASATNLKSFDRAAQNLGVTAGEAMDSVQGLARFLREQPGGEGLLESLGVQTRDVNGQLKDTTDIMLGLAEQFSRMPYYLAHQYAGIFGISEDTLRAMRSGGFAREVMRMREQMKDTGFDKASKDAHRFMMGLRDLVTQLERFGIQVYDALARRLGGSMEDFTEWLRSNGPAIADRVAEILVAVIDLAERIGAGLAWLIGKFIEWDKATDGWSTRILGLLVVLKMFGGVEIISGVIKLGAAFLTLGANMTTAATAGTGLLGLLGRLGVVAAAGAGGWFAGKGLYEHVLPQDWKDGIGKWLNAAAAMLGSDSAKESLAMNDPLTYLRLSGWKEHEAAALLANAKRESELNPHAVGDGGKAYGIFQWHPDRQAAFEKWAGKSIRQSTAAEQYDFAAHELRQGAERRAGALFAASRNAQHGAEILSRYYLRPAHADAEATKRGEMAVQIAQENTFHITSTEPVAVGKEVQREQNRANAELARNFQVAVH